MAAIGVSMFSDVLKRVLAIKFPQFSFLYSFVTQIIWDWYQIAYYTKTQGGFKAKIYTDIAFKFIASKKPNLFQNEYWHSGHILRKL